MPKTPTQLDLNKEDVALVLKADGSMQMYLPDEGDDEDLAPQNVVLAIQLAMGLKDEQVMARLDELLELSAEQDEVAE